jgi:hypothetical protein
MKLDRNRPYGQTYGADVGTMALFQDNVYFKVSGEVADCYYNREHSPHLFEPVEELSVVAPPPGEPIVVNPPAPGEPLDPVSMADLLASKSDAEIYTAAVKLRAMLDEVTDADVFIPDPSDKDLSIAFLLRHHGG